MAYIVTFFALSRLGYSILCLSPRLAPSACAGLLKKCSAIAVVPGKTQQIDQLVAETQKLSPINVIQTVSREDFDTIVSGSEENFARVNVDRESERNWTACILHSSGSTGTPVPFHITHRRLMINIPTSPDRREFNTFPMFHGYGSFIVVHNCMNKKSTYMYNPNLPMTADYIIKVAEEVRPEVLHMVPYTIELLAQSEKGVKTMKDCRRVVFSGSACSDDVGNSLVEKGVTIESMWGATEMGMLGSSSNRPPEDHAWDYIRVPKPINDHVLFKQIEEDIYECIYLKSLPSLVLSNSDDPPGSYWSRDMFKKHPTIPNAWKHIGRLDDRLTLINGEKVLPLRMEGRIRQDPLVREAVVFGTGRSIPGVLVFRNEESATLSDEDFIERIWPTIKAANTRAESFSQISKETVVPFGANIECPASDKESIKRAQVYAVFNADIDAMYEKLSYDGTGTLRLDIPQMEQWVLDTFRDQVGVLIPSVEDAFFAAGVNSLQAIQMRGLILKHIELGGHAKRLGQNVVFDMGTAARLAKYIRAIQLGEDIFDDDRDEVQQMTALIKKYSTFKKHEPGADRPDSKVVLLTGVTGSLGAELLAQCIKNPAIRHTYCLVRGPEPDERVISALRQRNASDPSKERFTVLAADLSEPSLGLSTDSYASLKSSVTHIIHSAWAVNFNLDLRAFEAQHLAGLHHLLQLSLSSPHSQPAELFFCSSIATALATPAPAVIPEGPIDNLTHALPQGYARSKLVAEHIVQNAVIGSGALARTFRIGQIVGDKATGLWNDAEAIPLIIRSALTLKVLPELEEEESWLPVDTLAHSICELADLSPSMHEQEYSQTAAVSTEKLAKDDDKEQLIYNLQNPSIFHWTRDLLPELARLGLDFQPVSPSIWLEKLRSYKGHAEANPAVKLLGHFESRYASLVNGSTGEGGVGKDRVQFAMEKAKRDTRSLRSAPRIIEDGYVEQFVRVWMEKWRSQASGTNIQIESSG